MFDSQGHYYAFDIAEVLGGNLAISGQFAGGSNTFFLITLDPNLNYCGDLEAKTGSLVANDLTTDPTYAF